MKKNKIFVYLLLAITILEISSMIQAFSANVNTSNTYTVLYERQVSQITAVNTTYIRGSQPPMLSQSGVHYIIANIKTNTTISGRHGAQVATYNIIDMSLKLGSPKIYKGIIEIQVKDFEITVTSTIPQLARIVIASYGMKELVWAGLSSGETTVSAYSYLNKSGEVILEFFNGTSFAKVEVPVTVNETYKLNETLSLVQFNITGELNRTVTVVIQNNFPRRYQQFSAVFSSEVANGSVNENYNVTVAYFNGTFVPALVWKGEGIGSLAAIYSGVGHLKSNSTFYFKTITFYGVNGTAIGYVHDVYSNKSFSMAANIGYLTINTMIGELKIVIGKGAVVEAPKAMGVTYINGSPVIIVKTHKGEVESTAYVNFTHPVFIHQAGALVEVSINTTSKYVILFNDNETDNVTTVRPVSVNVTKVTINGYVYNSQEVIVNSTSQYILFNVSLLVNSTAKPVVYKQTPSGLVEVNSTNVYVTNGKVGIVDDPSTIYYIVYPTTATSVSTTSTSSTSTSSTLVSTSSTSTTSVVSSSSVSTITPSQVSSTSASKTNYALIAIIAIVVVIIIAVVAVVLYRR